VLAKGAVDLSTARTPRAWARGRVFATRLDFFKHMARMDSRLRRNDSYFFWLALWPCRQHPRTPSSSAPRDIGVAARKTFLSFPRKREPIFANEYRHFVHMMAGQRHGTLLREKRIKKW
jgi:hypothetical protein